MGVRELIWGLIAALAAYVLWQIYRARRAQQQTPAAGGAAPGRTGAAKARAAAEDDEDGEFEAYAPTPRPTTAAAVPVPGGARAGEGFQLEFELQQLRRELAQLRSEQHAQRDAVSALADELRGLREQFDSNQASQGVSPEYDEALVFARRGLDAEAIAERCGISVAEAQLVLSLARGPGARGEAK